MVLDSQLVKLLIVQGAEVPRQSPESPDQPELCGDGVNGKPEPHLLRKRETVLGFPLRLGKRVARREHVDIQKDAAVPRKREVAGLARGLESAAHQLAASPDMSRQGQNDHSKTQIDPGPEPRQSASFDQVIAELTEARSGLVVAEAHRGLLAKHDIGEARPVAVAALEAEIDRSAEDQGQ